MDKKINSKEESLIILTEPEADAASIRDFLSPVKIPMKILSNNLEILTRKIGTILANIPEIGDYKLHEITINVNITAGGELQLIGIAKGKGDIKGGFSLKFSKK